MKHFDKRFKKDIIKTLGKDGFKIVSKGNKYIISKNNGPLYLTHSGIKTYHPLRRFLKTQYDYSLKLNKKDKK
tara:strand:- start:1878 stop:2096 length:219 start_codon:yes stop_codon:yes gene_type:complete